jgi:hypothetical protein
LRSSINAGSHPVLHSLLPQLQSRKPDQHQHHRDDPEALWVVLTTAAMSRKRNMA